MAVNEVQEVIVIGAGPAGLAAAIYTGRARRSTIVLEKRVPGGQILLTEWIENFPGYPDGVAPFELMENFKKHALKFGAKIVTDEATGLRRDGDRWTVVGRKAEYRARAVIVASGSDYRRLGVPGEKELIGRGVSYCAVCDGAFYKDLDAAVVGGGDNAVTEALHLTRFCRKVTLIHRRDKFRAARMLQDRVLANEKIAVLWDTVVESIAGTKSVESVRLRNVRAGRTFDLKVDGLFVSIGMVPHTDFVKGLLDLNEWGQIRVSLSMASSLPGIFAAGDVADTCPHQVATAVGTGVTAALSADEYLA